LLAARAAPVPLAVRARAMAPTTNFFCMRILSGPETRMVVGAGDRGTLLLSPDRMQRPLEDVMTA
jgi:hypothetical protein